MASGRPAKRTKLLSEDEDSGSESSSSGGAAVQLGFNEEYARRFEHNKKRAEQHRLEEKYGKDSRPGARSRRDEDLDDDSDESTDEDEDEDAELASGLLDDEFQATLKALQKKDPAIYDTKHKFYSTNPDHVEANGMPEEAKEKPLYLTDYHRRNLLAGDNVPEDSITPRPTYAEEQADIRKSFLDAAEAEDDDGSDQEDTFMSHKEVEKAAESLSTDQPLTDEIRNKAKDDPERFLSSFMDNKGWLTDSGSKLQAFESDDDDFDDIQDQFEHNYNMRFEVQDTKGKLQTFSRDMAAEQSVRKDATNKRQRARDIEKQQKEEEKQERRDEKARLRKLRLEEAEGKLEMIKKAAGMRGKSLDVEQWSSLLVGDWDDKEWERKFEENFGDKYYEDEDRMDGSGSDDEGAGDETKSRKSKKLKKPKFDDDELDITDLVPDFDEDQKFSITDDEGEDEEEDGEEKLKKKKKSSKDHKKEREDAKREFRKQRRKLETMIDEKLDADVAMHKATGRDKTSFAPFRYRETSPTSFGLTPTEILMASDSQLNQFVGIKKLASFRDDAKKRKDKKHLGKKARLRKWRQETFGNDEGPQKTLQDMLKEDER